MSDPGKPQQEPTMEEILASIRRIISEDGDAGPKPAETPAPPQPVAAAASAPPRVEPPRAEPPRVEPFQPETRRPEPARFEQPKAAPADDVLELTKMVDDDGSVIDLRTAPPALKVVASAPEPSPSPVMAPVPPPQPLPPVATPLSSRMPEMNSDDSLISSAAASAATSALAGLASAVSGQRSPATPMGDGGRTLEDIVRELLRPMLKDWLDANLGPLVQRIVEREVAKLVNRVDDR